jgi:flagellar biosynthesis component FlhA
MEAGKKITNSVKLDNGYVALTFDDDTCAIVKVIHESDTAVLVEGLGGNAEESDDEEEEEEEEELTVEALLAMDEEELTDLIDSQELDVDADDFEDDVEGMRKAIAKEVGLELPKAAKKKGKK